MIIERTFDIEDEVRKALSSYFTIYCRPLPKNFKLPSLLVTMTGGNDNKKIDGCDIIIDARAKNEAEALNLLLDATATLKAIAQNQNTNIRYVEINSSGSWGVDPIRPDLALASARLRIYTHKVEKEI